MIAEECKQTTVLLGHKPYEVIEGTSTGIIGRYVYTICDFIVSICGDLTTAAALTLHHDDNIQKRL